MKHPFTKKICVRRAGTKCKPFRALLLGAAFCVLSGSYTQAAPVFKWANQLKASPNEWGTTIALDKSGNVYTIGQFSGTVDFDPGTPVVNLVSAGAADAFITKTDASGKFVWAKQIGGTGAENAQAIALDASGNIYVTGNFSSLSMDCDPGTGTFTLNRSGTTDAFILKLDASGNFTWAKGLGGATADCSPFAVAADAGGNVYTAGYFSGKADFDPGTAATELTCKSSGYESYISKLSASGNFVWAKQLEGDDFNGVAFMTVDGPGNVYAMGVFETNMDSDPGTAVKTLTTAGLADVFALKLDPSGNFVWSTEVGGTEPDWPRGLALDASGNVIITGTFDSKADFDRFGSSYVMKSIGSSPGPDIFILKLSNSGKFVWARQLGAGGIGGVEATLGVTTDASGRIYLAGSFNGTMDMDPGSGATYLMSSPGTDAFVSVLDGSGDYVWAGAFRGADALSVCRSSGIAVDATGDNIYTTGLVLGKVNFDPAGGHILDATSGSYFIHKLGPKGSSVPEDPALSLLQVMPNPCSQSFRVAAAQPLQHALLTLTDMSGRTLLHKAFTGSYQDVDMNAFPAGMYLLELSGDELRFHSKIVKQ